MQNNFGVDVSATTQALERFSNNVRINVTKKAVRKAGNVVKVAMKLAAPRKTGALLSSIRTKTKVDTAGGRAYAAVGPTGKVMSAGSDGILRKRSQAYKANFIEYGTKYSTAKPFIQAAKDRSESKVLQVFEKEVEKAIQTL
jgi:HK97 gp10 family phage protein